jgi:phosphoserine phosphatase
MMSESGLQEILNDLDVRPRGNNLFPFAVFDYDNTIVENDLQQAFISYVCRHRLIRDKTLMHDIVLAQNDQAYHEAFFTHYWRLLSQGVTKDAFLFLLRALSSFRSDEMDGLVRAIVQEQGTALGEEEYLGVPITKGFRLRELVRELMQACVSRGIAPYVITASPEPLVRAALRFYRVPAAGCLGINLKEQDGIFLNRLIEPLPIEEGKITCIRKHIHTDTPLLGAGDSMNDYGMLNYASVRVAIDRQNELTRLARENGWHILKA